MWIWVIQIVGFITADLIKKLLISAGFAVVATILFNQLIQYFIGKAVSNLGGLSGSFIGLLGLFGLDKAISIIIGALVMRASIMALNLSFKKA